MRLAAIFASTLLLATAWTVGAAATARGAERPNFVWIVTEDNSVHYMRMFHETGAPTPNLAAMASQGLIFDRAFSNAPVCSVARTTLATGLYAPRVGTQYHRRIKPAQLPEGWRMFPFYLREAGYYTTNNSKKDYNCEEGSGVWDASTNRATWRDRPNRETPFFHMQSFPVSHESSLHFTAKQIDPAALRTDPRTVALAPQHPDTELFRYTYARYHDRMKDVDDIVGRMLAQLEEDGLLEDTFVFYFGDHGGVLPGSKGYLHEVGLHVPLVVRVPENWKHLVPLPRGSRVQGFVSFIDFGPTVIHLAGVPLPGHFDGRPFLGRGITAEELNARDETFAYADRFDEKYDLCRSLRKGRYKYLRNYQAFYPDGLQNNYRYNMLAYQQWRELYRKGQLNEVQRRFFESKPVELLFDVEADPYEVRNLAGDPAYADVLRDLRTRLQARVKGLPDLSFYPESHLVKHAMNDPVAFGKQHADEIAQLVDIADLALLPFDEAAAGLASALRSDDPWKRYWASIVCSCFGERAKSLADDARQLLDDPELLVRVRAAEFLGILGAADPRPALYQALEATDSPVEALLTLNTAVFFHDLPDRDYRIDLNGIKMRVQSGETDRRIEYLKR
ncbi:MAG: sulfatase-like hydrolase/transferase [Pirellulaceae bacterium]|nr:sulfatase-like hydrolase/transferase [Pirellulaceae bacterium]